MDYEKKSFHDVCTKRRAACLRTQERQMRRRWYHTARYVAKSPVILKTEVCDCFHIVCSEHDVAEIITGLF